MPLNRGTVSLEQIDKLEQPIFLDLLNFDNAVLNAEQGDGIALPKFQSISDIPTNLPKGTILFVSNKNEVYFWDGSSAVELVNANTSLSPDVSDNGTTVTNSTTDLNFSTNLGALDDGDGTSTIFVDISDDEKFLFGSDNDISQRYDSSNDSLRIKDEKNNIDRLEFERTTGNLSILGELTENASL
jgi:hypothetical protein